MKFARLLLLFPLFGYFSLSGQIIVTNATFPEPGDTLLTRTDLNAGGFIIQNPGPNRVWDFSALGGTNTTTIVFQDPSRSSNGDEFPTATSFVAAGNAGETFFQNTAASFSVLGANGTDVTGLGLQNALKFNPPYTVRRAPLEYNPSIPFTTQSSNTFRFSINDLPPFIRDTILGALPLQIDSLGFGIQQNRTDRVDAWGKLTIPGGTFDVLREQRFEIRGGKLEAKLPFLGWTDLTASIIAAGGVGNVGNDTTFAYYFWSNEAKEPVAVVNMTNDGQYIQSIEYKQIGRLSATAELPENEFLLLGPNPAHESIQIHLQAGKVAPATLKISDVNGKLYSEIPIPNQSGPLQVDLKVFSTGSYFFSFFDKNGTLLTTRKILIQK